MVDKIRIAVIFGGRSGEHEVSLLSARSVLSVLDPGKYEVTQIGITSDGRWFAGEDVLELLGEKDIGRSLPCSFAPRTWRKLPLRHGSRR